MSDSQSRLKIGFDIHNYRNVISAYGSQPPLEGIEGLSVAIARLVALFRYRTFAI